MPLWVPPTLTQSPCVVLVQWRLIQTELGETHAVGYNVLAAEGRVSSPLSRFDATTKSAVTRSGRMYVLDGAPGDHPDARHVFDAWLELNRVQRWADVTDEVLAHGFPAARGAADAGALGDGGRPPPG